MKTAFSSTNRLRSKGRPLESRSEHARSTGLKCVADFQMAACAGSARSTSADSTIWRLSPSGPATQKGRRPARLRSERRRRLGSAAPGGSRARAARGARQEAFPEERRTAPRVRHDVVDVFHEDDVAARARDVPEVCEERAVPAGPESSSPAACGRVLPSGRRRSCPSRATARRTRRETALRLRAPPAAGPSELRLERGAVLGRHGEVDAAEPRRVAHGSRGLEKMFVESRARPVRIPMKRQEALRRRGESIGPSRPPNANPSTLSKNLSSPDSPDLPRGETRTSGSRRRTPERIS